MLGRELIMTSVFIICCVVLSDFDITETFLDHDLDRSD
jgi:hypothetical protein